VSAQLWAELRMPELAELREAGAVVLIPVGAIEQHGPHLPVDTDIHGAYHASVAVAEERPHVVVAPPVCWGLSSAHRGFAGLLTLRPETFIGLLTDLADSLIDDGFTRIAFVVAHGSNKPAVALAVQAIMRRRRVGVLQVNWLELSSGAFGRVRRSPRGGEFHAGELETSVQLHLRPDRVVLGDAPRRLVEPAADLGHSEAPGDIFGGAAATIGFDLKPVFPDGVMGDPTVASAETGRICFEEAVARLGRIVDEFHDATNEKVASRAC
jgi:creatinine amidohydrolase